MSRIYSVKEMYFTLQGEGAQTGRAAVFLRFAGCNLWSGLERDRAGAICSFCDTDFVGTDGEGGGKFQTPQALAEAVLSCWRQQVRSAGTAKPYVICTGGEPLLQLDTALITSLHQAGFEIGVETNGTLKAPDGIDWICVSPKATARLEQLTGDELKLVYPQATAQPEKFSDLAFRHFFLQPLDGPDISRHTSAAIDYCRAHPQWRLSLQTHKLTGIP
ncbi:7-carboxy-7-deazaguanine synthase [Parvularcula sp. IMCC14364]|uniref:7-carboxy-7-deazaguanine synthase n=1 Tax=Parvularcula sp. IMCC14364 TaxID=3067902 RepID=UPI0027403EC3|nr:7-carboxy-7-deazaguanine synthase [Parvularcula sp. IMCC14364]